MYEHRPNLVRRVFHAKLLEFIDDIANKFLVLFSAICICSIEFQKRGLPHAHILVTLCSEDKLNTEELVDSAVSAVIPNEEQKPKIPILTKKNIDHADRTITRTQHV